jgi:hypothetical protein
MEEQLDQIIKKNIEQYHHRVSILQEIFQNGYHIIGDKIFKLISECILDNITYMEEEQLYDFKADLLDRIKSKVE